MTVMEFRRSTWGTMTVAECPECGTICVYWDEDDLNEDGQLVCQCEEGE